MDSREMQRQVDRWIGQFQEGYWPPLAMLAVLSEELGELAREVNHRYGAKPKKADEGDAALEMEVGDMLCALVTFANAQGIDLEEAFNRSMDKYWSRDAGRWTPRRD